jgi:DNA-binding transcriptional regulator LsrR (DeoR family)
VPFIRWSAHTRCCLDDIKQNPPDYALINTRFYGLSQLAARLMNRLGVRPVVLDHGTDSVGLPNPVVTHLIAAAEHFRTALLKRQRIDFYGVSKGSTLVACAFWY